MFINAPLKIVRAQARPVLTNTVMFAVPLKGSQWENEDLA